MLVWTRDGDRLVGRVAGKVAVVLRRVDGLWRWQLGTTYLAEVLNENPMARLPEGLNGHVRGDEVEAKAMAAVAVSLIAA